MQKQQDMENYQLKTTQKKYIIVSLIIFSIIIISLVFTEPIVNVGEKIGQTIYSLLN